MPTYWSTTGTNMTANQYYYWVEQPLSVALQQPAVPVPNPFISPSSCDCWSCRDFNTEERIRVANERDQARRINEVIEHFDPPSIAFHPTPDFINPFPEKEPVITNPLPEPNIVTIRNRRGSVLRTITAETLVGYDFRGMDLENADLSSMDVSGADMSRVRLYNANLTNLVAVGTNFNRAYINDSAMQNITATDATFVSANMDYCDVRGAHFEDADFANASLYSLSNTSSADFSGANLSGVTGVQQCASCATVEFRSTGNIQFVQDMDEYRCSDCGWEECEYCNNCYDDLYDHQDNCSDRRHSALHEYDYTPYRFMPKGNFPAEPLMGVELEIGGDEFTLTNIVNNLDPNESHLYCKHDGSVDGIEVVTHPMTLDWCKQNFDFKNLLGQLSRSGHSSDNYGIHVHVSRNAFRGVLPDGRTTKKAQPQHQMAWLMFMYRNADAITKIARRTSDNWASWRKPGTGELKRKASAPDHSQGRYIAINCENDKTYEVRVFRSTLDFTEFMAAIELVDASVNYTRNLTTFDVLHNQAMSWPEFNKWCKAQGARYSSLLNQMKVQNTLV